MLPVWLDSQARHPARLRFLPSGKRRGCERDLFTVAVDQHFNRLIEIVLDNLDGRFYFGDTFDR